MRRALVVEDDHDIGSLVRLHLQDLGCEVRVCRDGAEGRRFAMKERWSLIVLDVLLPGENGFEICRRLRESGVVSPILILTACSSEQDCVLSLEIGADDFIAKPFSVVEFSARAKAVMRRAERLSAAPAQRDHSFTFGDLAIDLDSRRVTRAETPITLTAREFDLLAYFVRNPRRVYSRSQLLEQIWGASEAYEHTVNSHINRLRAKIESDPTNPEFIVTVWGAGYRFDGGIAA
jgi:DNA-binding response OmpR family regulator